MHAPLDTIAKLLTVCSLRLHVKPVINALLVSLLKKSALQVPINLKQVKQLALIALLDITAITMEIL